MVRHTLRVTPWLYAPKGDDTLWVSGDTIDYHMEHDAIVTSWRVVLSMMPCSNRNIGELRVVGSKMVLYND